jgi:hypothetical protein
MQRTDPTADPGAPATAPRARARGVAVPAGSDRVGVPRAVATRARATAPRARASRVRAVTAATEDVRRGRGDRVAVVRGTVLRGRAVPVMVRRDRVARGPAGPATAIRGRAPPGPVVPGTANRGRVVLGRVVLDRGTRGRAARVRVVRGRGILVPVAPGRARVRATRVMVVLETAALAAVRRAGPVRRGVRVIGAAIRVRVRDMAEAPTVALATAMVAAAVRATAPAARATAADGRGQLAPVLTATVAIQVGSGPPRVVARGVVRSGSRPAAGTRTADVVAGLPAQVAARAPVLRVQVRRVPAGIRVVGASLVVRADGSRPARGGKAIAHRARIGGQGVTPARAVRGRGLWAVGPLGRNRARIVRGKRVRATPGRAPAGATSVAVTASGRVDVGMTSPHLVGVIARPAVRRRADDTRARSVPSAAVLPLTTGPRATAPGTTVPRTTVPGTTVATATTGRDRPRSAVPVGSAPTVPIATGRNRDRLRVRGWRRRRTSPRSRRVSTCGCCRVRSAPNCSA